MSCPSPAATAPAKAPEPPPVRRRCVMYLSGFDPQGPAHYHQLYQQEAARQAAVNGSRIEVGGRRKAGADAKKAGGNP